MHLIFVALLALLALLCPAVVGDADASRLRHTHPAAVTTTTPKTHAAEAPSTGVGSGIDTTNTQLAVAAAMGDDMLAHAVAANHLRVHGGGGRGGAGAPSITVTTDDPPQTQGHQHHHHHHHQHTHEHLHNHQHNKPKHGHTQHNHQHNGGDQIVPAPVVPLPAGALRRLFRSPKEVVPEKDQYRCSGFDLSEIPLMAVGWQARPTIPSRVHHMTMYFCPRLSHRAMRAMKSGNTWNCRTESDTCGGPIRGGDGGGGVQAETETETERFKRETR